MAEDTASEQEQNVPTGPRLGFPVAVVVIQLALMFGVNAYGSTNIENVFGLGLVPLVAAILLSIWWLRHFRFGPAEWLLRTLTYGRLQPMRV